MKCSSLHLAAFVLSLFGALPLGDTLSPVQIQKLLTEGKFERAAEALEQIVTEGKPDGVTWYLLGHAKHGLGDYPAAIEAGERAVAFPEVRASALYNLACAYSLSGELDLAETRLCSALELGFVDFELIETDTDLEPLRKAGRLPELPPKLEYQVLRARNGLDVAYRILLPTNFDAGREYPFVLAFAPGVHRTRDADWMISELFPSAMGEHDLVTVVVLAPEPEKGWHTHPSHHALEDLLKKLNKDYRVRGNRYHMLGFLSGHRPAVTYSEMSRKYAAGLIVAAASPCQTWSDKEVRELGELPVALIAGTEDDLNRAALARMSSLLGDSAGFERRDVEGDGPLLASLRGERLLNLLVELVGAQAR